MKYAKLQAKEDQLELEKQEKEIKRLNEMLEGENEVFEGLMHMGVDIILEGMFHINFTCPNVISDPNFYYLNDNKMERFL